MQLASLKRFAGVLLVRRLFFGECAEWFRQWEVDILFADGLGFDAGVEVRSQPIDGRLHHGFWRARPRRDQDGLRLAELTHVQILGSIDQVRRFPMLDRQLLEPLAVAAVLAAQNHNNIDADAQQSHGLLTVLRGVADIIFGWAIDLREPRPQSADHAVGIVDAERRLGQISEPSPRRELEFIDTGLILDEHDCLGRLTHGSENFIVTLVTDEDDRVARFGVLDRFEVNLRHERARRIERVQISILGGLADLGGYTVRGEQQHAALGRLIDVVDKHRPLVLKRIDDVLVMNDLVVDIHRRSKLFERQLQRLDRHVDTCTKPTGGRQNNFHRVKIRRVELHSIVQNNRVANVSSNRLTPETDGRDAVSLQEAEFFCRRLAKSHYENFLVATAFLPRRLRQPFFNIYAFCRTADDLADESPSREIASEQLASFQNQLNEAFAGRPRGEIFVALADTAQQYSLDQAPLDRLLAAFRQDQWQTRYATRAELLDYCEDSANPVGEILLQLCGCSTPETVRLSDEICTGLQLVNFWQDVQRDHSLGRIYLPWETMHQFAVEESMFGLSETPQPLRRAIAHECEQAEQHFRRGLPLVDHVPRWFARDVTLFAHGGLAVIDAIRRIDFDVLRIRPVVTKRTQFRLMAYAWLRCYPGFSRPAL